MNMMEDKFDAEGNSEEVYQEGKNTKSPPRNPMPPAHVMDEANKQLKDRMDREIEIEEYQESIQNNIHFKNQSYLNEMNLSDEKSRRIASTILSMEPEKNGYFNYVKKEMDESIGWLRNNRMQSISNLDSQDIIARLFIKNEKMSTDTILKIKSCKLNDKIMGYNMDLLLTNKRLILVDNDDDVVNTISGNYNGSYPKSADLKLHSRNYFNLLFQPFRLSDVTDLNVNFRYGSETKKTISRGWPVWGVLGIYMATVILLGGFLSILGDMSDVDGGSGLGFCGGIFLSLFAPIIMTFYPPKWPTTKSPIFLTNIREVSIKIVNEFTKDVKILNVEVDDNQSIESILEWIETLQSLSSMT